MTDTQRVFVRLRRRALQCYEVLLFAMLLALAGGIAQAASWSAAEEPVHCGNIQSSAVVISR
jgi:hypothetical protein